MFTLSKIFAAVFLSPMLFLILIGILFLFWRRNHKAFLVVLGILFFSIYLLSIPLVRNALSYPLESKYKPPTKILKKDILILGGGLQEKTLEGRPLLAKSSLLRAVKGYQLYRLNKGKIIVCGGRSMGGPAEGPVMAKFLISLGVPTRDIIVENRSRNTYENIRFASKYLRGKEVYLVTGAYHLPRAVAVARKAGVRVYPVPSDYLTEGSVFWRDILPTTGALNGSFMVLREYFGLLYYFLRAWV